MYKWKLEQLAKQLEVGLAINDINPKKKKSYLREERILFLSSKQNLEINSSTLQKIPQSETQALDILNMYLHGLR